MAGNSGESEQGKGGASRGPILEAGIGTRIRAAADAIGSRAEAAAAAGVSDDMLYRYIREESPPRFEAIVGLARRAGMSLEWMATGYGEPHLVSDQVALYELAPGTEAARARLDEIEKLLDHLGPRPLTVADQAPDTQLAQVLRDLRATARDQELPRPLRLRAARAGATAFADDDLARLQEALEQEAAEATGRTFRRVTQDLEAAICEVGYEPRPLVREGLKTAMYSHGLTRSGAVTLLQFLQADADDTR